MDADAGSEERDGEASLNAKEGGTSTRGANEQIVRSVEDTDRSIKMFDRMSRQPTVEDDDSDLGSTSVQSKDDRSAAPSVQRLKLVEEESPGAYGRPLSAEADANEFKGMRSNPSSSRLASSRGDHTLDRQPTRSQVSLTSEQSPSTKRALEIRGRFRESSGGPSSRTSRRVRFPRDLASFQSGASSYTSSHSATESAQDPGFIDTSYIPVRTARSSDELTDLDQSSVKAQQSSTESCSEHSDSASSASHSSRSARKVIANRANPSSSLVASDEDYNNKITKSSATAKDKSQNRPYVSHRNEDKARLSGGRQGSLRSEIEEHSTSEEESENSWDFIGDRLENSAAHRRRFGSEIETDYTDSTGSRPPSQDQTPVRQSKHMPITRPPQNSSTPSRAAQGRRASVSRNQGQTTSPRPENMVFKFAPRPPVPSSVGSSSLKQNPRRHRRALSRYSSRSSSGDNLSGYPLPPPPPQAFPGNFNHHNTPYLGYQEHLPNPFATSGDMPNPFAPPGFTSYGQQFYQPPLPPPPPPPPPPPVTSPGHPVVRELRALLAPPVHDLPPSVPPALPVVESYASDDDETRTVVAEPRSGQNNLYVPGSSLSHAGLLTESEADHLDDLRFEARIPLHPYRPTLTKKWPAMESVEDEHSRRRFEALKAHRFRRGDDGWQSIELQCRQGPSSSLTSEHAQVEWLHIASDSMNLGTLEDHCLGAPSITQELQHVVARLFEKIRKFYRQRFFDGYLLTPGTVLRWDGITSGYDTAQSLTATFVCFPYLTLQPFAMRNETDGEGYPSRSVLQTLYPYDSTFKQDMPPSFSKISPSAAERVMLVPQIWCVSIGHKYVITYTQLTSPELCEETVRISQHLSESESTVQQWQSGSRQDCTKETEKSENILLFEGRRVEEYEVSEHSVASEEGNLAMSSLPKANTWHNLSPAVIGTLSQQAEQTVERPSSSGLERNPGSRWRPAGPMPRLSRCNPTVKIGSDTPIQICVDELRPTAAMLSTIESPEFTPDYVETVKTCLASLIKKWSTFVAEPVENCEEEHQQFQQGIQTADQLQKILDLEDANPGLAARGEYRASLIRIFGLGSIEKEVATLGEIVEVVYRLIRTSGTKEAQIAFNMKRFEDDVPVIKQTNELRKIAEGSFLAWPWISSSMGTTLNPTEEDANRLSDNLRRILQDSNDRIQRRDDRSYSATTKATLTTLNDSLMDFRASLPVHSEGLSCPEDLNERLPQSDAQNLLGDSGNASQMFQSKHRQQLTVTAIETLIQASQDLVAKFVPCIFPHHVLEKIWGSLEATSKLMIDSLDHDRWMRPPAYIIRRPDETTIRRHNSSPPTTPLELCSSCNSGYLYGSWPEALAHVRSHFRNARSGTLDDHLREDWIQRANSVRSALVNTHHLRIAKISTEYLESLSLRAESIHDRTRSRGDDDSRYTLPGGLVDCFETIALFIAQVGTIMFGIQQEIECRDWLPIVEVELQMGPYALSRLGHLGQAAQQAMTRAEKALVLSDITATVELESAGPELLVAILLQNIQRRALLPEDDQGNYALYHTYVSKLQYQISRFPRRRLFHDIHVLEEEIEVVRKVNEWQQQCFEDLMIIMDPRSFSSPADDRVVMFPAERAGLQQSLDHLAIESRELKALSVRIQYLRNQLRQSVEILEEDHGKAIFVFTMVTTIFLPLSFVSSFFGMNFVDIRDMERTQGVFWACAVPVTAGIIIIAVSLANHGDKVFETLNHIWQKIKGREQDSPLKMITGDKQDHWNGSTNGLPQTQNTQRRKRAIWR